MRPLRASDIGSFLFCKRAWWYAAQGIPSANRAEMSSGTRLHRQHGRRALAIGCLRLAAYALLLAALVFITIYLVSSWI